jgi:hypothetical protein
LPRENYKFAQRKRELDKKRKKEEKAQRKAAERAARPAGGEPSDDPTLAEAPGAADAAAEPDSKA